MECPKFGAHSQDCISSHLILSYPRILSHLILVSREAIVNRQTTPNDNTPFSLASTCGHIPVEKVNVLKTPGNSLGVSDNSLKLNVTPAPAPAPAPAHPLTLPGAPTRSTSPSPPPAATLSAPSSCSPRALRSTRGPVTIWGSGNLYI